MWSFFPTATIFTQKEYHYFHNTPHPVKGIELPQSNLYFLLPFTILIEMNLISDSILNFNQRLNNRK